MLAQIEFDKFWSVPPVAGVRASASQWPQELEAVAVITLY